MIFNHDILKRNSRECLRYTCHPNRISNCVSSLNRKQSDIKSRSFIFFYLNARICPNTIYPQRITPGQARRRQHEFTGERTERVGTYTVLGYFLLIHVQELNSIGLIRQNTRAIVILPVSDTGKINGLSRTVNAAVGKQVYPFIRLCIIIPFYKVSTYPL